MGNENCYSLFDFLPLSSPLLLELQIPFPFLQKGIFPFFLRDERLCVR